MSASPERKVDRSTWGAGPWDAEPEDRVEFRHAGLPCILRRSDLGSWCGYVGVPPGHPAHGKPFNRVDASVHGGLTYSEACAGEVCHVPEPGEPDDVWWLGFDLAHAFDVQPGLAIPGWPVFDSCSYRTLGYARRETEALAEQLARARAADDA